MKKEKDHIDFSSFDAVIISLDKEYNKREVGKILKKIVEIKGVDKAEIGLMNIEKNIAAANRAIKDIGYVWMRIKEEILGVIGKKGQEWR